MMTIGFELEFGDLERTPEVTAAKYSGRPLAERTVWTLRTDGSCGDVPGVAGYELNSPIIRDQAQLEWNLSFIADWVVRMKATMNKRCGFHTHIGGFDTENGDLMAVTKFMCRYEKAFQALVEPERRVNNYCTALGASVRKNIQNSPVGYVGVYSAWDSRRCWLNALSLVKHGTLELRLPEGTLDVNRIRGWINLYLACCEGVIAKHLKNPTRSVRSPELSSTEDAAMLVHDMLTSAGTYGAMAKEKGGWGDAALARKFAASRFKEIHGVSYRTVVDKQTRARAKFKAGKATYEAQVDSACDYDLEYMPV